MIDAGRSDKRQALAAALERAGCRQGDLGLVVITYGDHEHAGNAPWAREKFGARIAMYRDDVERIGLGDWRVGFEPRPDRVSWIFKEVSRRVETGASEMLEPDIYLEDGQSLSEHGFDATVLRLRGPGGDATAILVSESGPASHLFVSDMGVAKANAERLSSLGVEMVYPAHGRPATLERVRELHV